VDLCHANVPSSPASVWGNAQYLGCDSRHLATFEQPDGLQLEFQCVPRPSYRFAHFSLLKLIFTYQLRSTFFGGKVSFWLVSLTQIGLVFYGDREWRGLNILVWGWMTILQFNLAWLANPLFLWALVRILGRRGAIVFSVWVFILSLFTFAMESAPTLGGSMKLYGYGPLGCLAIHIATDIVSVGFRENPDFMRLAARCCNPRNTAQL
jgi:hypothetical protein